MLSKPLLVAGIAALLLTILIIFGACRHRTGHCFLGHSHEDKAEWIVKKISKELKLTDPQKQKLNGIKDEILTKQSKLKKDREEIFNAVLAEVKKEQIDQQTLIRHIEANGAHIKEMHTFMVTKFTEFHSILTPEQRLLLAEKMTQLHDKMPH